MAPILTFAFSARISLTVCLSEEINFGVSYLMLGLSNLDKNAGITYIITICGFKNRSLWPPRSNIASESKGELQIVLDIFFDIFSNFLNKSCWFSEKKFDFRGKNEIFKLAWLQNYQDIIPLHFQQFCLLLKPTKIQLWSYE